MPGQSWFEGAEFDATQANVYFPDSARLVRFGLIGHIEPAFAITIHQSQGSEYHHVAVLMPQDPNSGLATRELFYTAVTRVRDERNGKQTTYGSLDVFGNYRGEKALRTRFSVRAVDSTYCRSQGQNAENKEITMSRQRALAQLQTEGGRSRTLF